MIFFNLRGWLTCLVLLGTAFREPPPPPQQFYRLPLSLLKLRMSLDQNLDLALIGYQELIAIAERKSLDSPSSLARPELVQALRTHGVGGKPVTDTGTSCINDSKL